VRPADSLVPFLGVISDTHGLIRPSALEALRGARRILHAGDIGGDDVLEALRALAPVSAVRGNTDAGPLAASLPALEWIREEGLDLVMVHDRASLDLDPASAGVGVVVTGHSHRPEAVVRGGVLFLNPGSAGPRRFHLPVTVARLWLDPEGPQAEIVPV
jgi:uncharacterized protein